jgi:hypothetical protein
LNGNWEEDIGIVQIIVIEEVVRAGQKIVGVESGPRDEPILIGKDACGRAWP